VSFEPSDKMRRCSFPADTFSGIEKQCEDSASSSFGVYRFKSAVIPLEEDALASNSLETDGDITGGGRCRVHCSRQPFCDSSLSEDVMVPETDAPNDEAQGKPDETFWSISDAAISARVKACSKRSVEALFRKVKVSVGLLALPILMFLSTQSINAFIDS